MDKIVITRGVTVINRSPDLTDEELVKAATKLVAGITPITSKYRKDNTT